MKFKMTQRFLKTVLEYNPDTGIFVWIDKRISTKRKEAGFLNHYGYRVIMIAYSEYTAGRLAWMYMTGKFPSKGKVVIFKNKDRTDLSWKNLDIMTFSEAAHR
jgi:hypothetical protein